MIASFLYQPSYISLESALAFHGIITGFPYQITSLTIKKPETFVFENRDYQYSQIASSLFWGYEKKENFLIATKEKSFLDYLYFAFKGRRVLDSVRLSDDFELEQINKRRLKENLKMIRNKSFIKYLRKLKI